MSTVIHMERKHSPLVVDSLCGQSYNFLNVTNEVSKVTCKLCLKNPKLRSQ